MKKTLATLLALLLVLTLVPTVALAAEVSVGDYAALAAAITAANTGDTIKLTADITDIQQMTISKAITINMNGFSISGKPTSYTAFRVEAGGDLTLDNTSTKLSKLLVGAGLDTEYDYEGIRIAGGGKATVKANVSIETGLPVFIFGNGTPGSAQLHLYGNLKVSKPLANGDAYAGIQGNGTAGKGGTIINIHAGANVLNEYSQAMYIPQAGEINITGGTIVGKGAAVALKSGTLNISGGTLRATGQAVTPPAGWSNGINASGCAIQIESNKGYAGNIEVNITGGNIISANGYALYEYLSNEVGNTDTRVNSITISGGTFFSGIGLTADMLFSEQLDKADPSRITLAGGTFSKGNDTEVKAAVNPTYMIEIPAMVDFGELIKGSGKLEKDFAVTASGVLIEPGAKIDVKVTSSSGFQMSNGKTDPKFLAYELFNTKNAEAVALVTDATFAQFDKDGSNVGKISVDTANITVAGNYSDRMMFSISYANGN